MTSSSILKCSFEVLFGNGTHSTLLLFHTGLMANIRIRINNKTLNNNNFTVSEIGVSQTQHFFLYVNLRYALFA